MISSDQRRRDLSPNTTNVRSGGAMLIPAIRPQPRPLSLRDCDHPDDQKLRFSRNSPFEPASLAATFAPRASAISIAQR